ncbi:MAG: putative transport system ATP-binding protein [Acidimicrobiaceae bacterium]|nr:putative transport system ATP-binding protein [Acidimicrobiaceae bacterium]
MKSGSTSRSTPYSGRVQTEVDRPSDAPVGQRPPILVATGVRKVYRTGAESVEALRDIDLTVDAGEFLAVMGPSGSGKTTLLNCLSGLDEIDGGRIEIDGEDLTAMSDARRTAHRAKAMGFIFQAFNLIPVFTATENVELPLLLAGTAPKKARAAAQNTLSQVGLGHRLNHRPPELSGGEQQRVTIARALAGQPKIVWADEPTGNLDTETAAQVMGLLDELHKEGLTIILVTHDKEIGATAERRIEVRDGRIVSDERLVGTARAGNGVDLRSPGGNQPPGRTDRPRAREARRDSNLP